MPRLARKDLLQSIQQQSQRLFDSPSDFDRLVDQIGNPKFILLGEASHGTQEFYEARARITQLLIERKGVRAVAVEADWPDAYRVNRYVRHTSGDRSADEALSGFRRFPTWMWRNTEVLSFVEWLRDWNGSLKGNRPMTGFYGIDLYSLYASRNEVVRYLERVDPEAARRARYRYSCFDHFGEDTQAYGYAASFDLSESCEREVLQQLQDLQQRATLYASRDGAVAEDEYFYTEQNARLVKNAEEYYRAMFSSRVSSWNLRDRHMADTIDALSAHLEKSDPEGTVVIWAHNSHLGDASFTEMGTRGELNLGQLLRERHTERTFHLGFTTDHGFVTAANDWDGPPEQMRVRPALAGSYEALFHDASMNRFLLDLRLQNDLSDTLAEPLLERAIGVIYRPKTERVSHYFQARLSQQFDCIIHYDETTAVEPLETLPASEKSEVPETYPSEV